MHAAHELSCAVRTRREELGLTQAKVAELTGLSRATINQLEAGTLKDLSLTRTARLLETLGLSLTISPAHPKRPSASGGAAALELAARTASVSYARRISSDVLGQAIRSGDLPAGFEPHMNALLEEAPLSLLARAIEEVHSLSDVPREALWSNLRRMARQLKSRRDLWDAGR